MRSRTEAGGPAVDSGRACALVALHPLPCHQQKAGIGDEVEQIIEPTMGSSFAQRCSLVWISSTRCLACNKPSSGSLVFTSVLPVFQHFGY